MVGVLEQCWGWDTQGSGHPGQGTLDSRWRSSGPGPREQRASIICTCVEQQDCNLKTCNTDCLHFCNPGQLCAEFPYWKEKLHEWGMQRRRRLLPFAAQAMHRIWERAREPTWTLTAPSKRPLAALLGRGVALGSPGRRTVPREGPRQGAAPKTLRREPGHRDHQLGVSGDMYAITGWGHVLPSWGLIVINVIADSGQNCSLVLQEPWENWHWILAAKDNTAQFLLYAF